MIVRRFPWALVLASLAICALAIACGQPGNLENKAKQSSVRGTDSRPIPVEVAMAEVREVPIHIDATGSFVAEESSEVAPLGSGRVVETPVDVGAFVNRGDIIVRLDDSDARLRVQQAKASAQQTEAAVRQAQSKIGLNPLTSFDPTTVPEVQASRANYESAVAEVKLAEADAQRYANLVQTGDVSQSNYEKARTQAVTATARADAARRQYEAAMNAARQNYQGVESAQASMDAALAQLAIAEKALEDTVIRAPIRGYVSARSVSVGEHVSPSSKIATILRADPIKLQLQVPEADAGRVSVGRPVSSRVAAHGTRVFTGHVSALNPAVDASSRAMTIEAKLNNPGLALRPGMFATARILLAGAEKAVLVPRTAVVADPSTDSAHAFVIEAGKARVRVVRIGEPENGLLRILSGISGGEEVAASRLDQLYDGASVQRERR